MEEGEETGKDADVQGKKQLSEENGGEDDSWVIVEDVGEEPGFKLDLRRRKR